MIAQLLVALPAAAPLALLVPAVRARAEAFLVLVGALVAGLSLRVAAAGDAGPFLDGLARIDATSRLFLALIDPVFLGIAAYVWNRVAITPALRGDVARFAGFALAFLATANAVLIADHLLVLWTALEASALAAAPLIVRADSPASRLASFRYLLFSSVGLGLVLLGILCLARGMEGAGLAPSFAIADLARDPGPADAWQRLGVALIVLGLGTKLGLAPMYTWLPEAYDEAPPATTALLSAIQFNCALVVLFRFVHLYRPANAALLTGELVTLGVASLVVSTFGIVATRNFKRLIAYAAINHAGAIAIGLGIGKAASYGLLLYVLSNAYIKAILFLSAGKIKAHYRTKDTRRISGLIVDLPYSGLFLMIGTFALLGLPPFGGFFGELLILSAMISSGQIVVFALSCLIITACFIAIGRTLFPMIWGEPKGLPAMPRQTLFSVSPKLAFLAGLLVLGIYIPSFVDDLLQQVAAALEGT